jgi:hypothetical protein
MKPLVANRMTIGCFSLAAIDSRASRVRIVAAEKIRQPDNFNIS